VVPPHCIATLYCHIVLQAMLHASTSRTLSC
jgi:hypothetical protein